MSTIIPEIIGFFIIESHVLRTTKGFRSEREVEELWIDIVSRVGEGMNQALASETDPDVFLDVKESLSAFSATLEVEYFNSYRDGTFPYKDVLRVIPFLLNHYIHFY